MFDLKNNSVERLFKTVTEINNVDDCRNFFEDLCTIKEIQDMAQRLDTAFLLDEGLSYQKIVEKIGASTATISRVNRCLLYGSGGYKNVISAAKEKENDNK